MLEKIDVSELPKNLVFEKPQAIKYINEPTKVYDITVENDNSFVLECGWIVHNSRYTSVATSKFAKDVLYRDIEIIPIQDNYDQTLEEPVHFLPLIPLVLLNPSEGIAIGFASYILPRSLPDIINAQIAELSNKPYEDAYPSFSPNNAVATKREVVGDVVKWTFEGVVEKINSFELQVTELPYSISHEKFTNKLAKLEEENFIKDYIDDSSDSIDITIKFQRGYLNNVSISDIMIKLGLVISINENFVITDLTGDRVFKTTFVEVIQIFTNWRLKFYVDRYERLLSILRVDIQKYKDIILSIDKNLGNVARKLKNKDELRSYLEKIGVVNIDYISDLPVYRFTINEKDKIEEKLRIALQTEAEYVNLLSDDNKRIKIYINELKEILRKFNKGEYNV